MGPIINLGDRVERPTWIVDGDINADYTSAAIDCRGYNLLELSWLVQEDSDPVANLYVQMSVDNSVWGNTPMRENTLITSDAATITHTSADLTKIVINDPAAAATIAMAFLYPLSYVRFFYDRTSGGIADGIDAGYNLQR